MSLGVASFCNCGESPPREESGARAGGNGGRALFFRLGSRDPIRYVGAVLRSDAAQLPQTVGLRFSEGARSHPDMKQSQRSRGGQGRVGGWVWERRAGQA